MRGGFDRSWPRLGGGWHQPEVGNLPQASGRSGLRKYQAKRWNRRLQCIRKYLAFIKTYLKPIH